MLKHLANALSLSRIPLGLAIYNLEVSGHFGWALGLLAIGAITDGFDGWAARKFGTPTPWAGKLWIDPLCDACMFMATALGLIHWLPNSTQLLIRFGIPFLILWGSLKLIKLRKNGSRLHLFVNQALPYAEWGGFWAFGLILSALAHGWIGAFIYLALTWPTYQKIRYYKGHRMRTWGLGEA